MHRGDVATVDEQIAEIKALLQERAGVAAVSHNGRSVTYSRAELLQELRRLEAERDGSGRGSVKLEFHRGG